MATLLVDANLDGDAALMARRVKSEYWREFGELLGIRFLNFEQVDLDRAATDNVVWRLCQQKGYYLLTANRNRKSDDSLEATIQREGTAQSLPVFTIADKDRIFQSASYLDDVVESLFEYLLDPDNCLGTGRLYLP